MLKRFFDIIVSSIGLIVLAPAILIISLLVLIKLGRPIFFKQKRPGLTSKPFEMYKFRSMKNCKDEYGKLLPNEQRLTKFGKILRSTSLDELPELYNVLKGEMSFVGPRPLLIEYLPYFTEEQKKRHKVRPGITGWAQVNGRNTINWDEKFDLDVWYVENQGFWIDIKILIMTLIKVFKREGISHQGHVTMPRFDQWVKSKSK